MAAVILFTISKFKIFIIAFWCGGRGGGGKAREPNKRVHLDSPRGRASVMYRVILRAVINVYM